nr:MAG: capsid protein [Ilomantsi toti-like virus 1]
MEQPCLRWLLLLEYLTWQFGWQCTPQGMLSIFDPNVKATKDDVILSVNSSPVFGEACGGVAAPVYPFGGGHGTLRLHVAMLSVPEERIQSAEFLNNNILGAADDPSKVLAIMCIGMSEWPFAMLGYDILSEPKNKNATHLARSKYMNHHVATPSLVHVSGPRDLNFILPSVVADASGRQQTNTRPRFVLKSGPTPTNTLPANTRIRYCTSDANEPVDGVINLTDFIVSWISSITPDDLVRTLNKINDIIPLGKSLAAMRDVVNVACYMYPKLTLGKQNEYPEPYQATAAGRFDTKVLLDYTMGAGLAPHPTKEDFPLEDTFQGNFLIQAFDYVAWNQVVVGLAKPDLPDKVRAERVNTELANRPVLSANVARSVLFSIAWNVMLQWYGASCQVWENHKEIMTSTWIPDALSVLYGCVSTKTEESLAPSGYAFSNLMAAFSGMRPTTITWKFDNGVHRPVTVFDRLCFTPYMATVYSKVGVEYKGYIPVTLPDAWIQMGSRYLPQGWCTFPSPGGAGAPMILFNTPEGFLWYHTLTIGDEVWDSSLLPEPFLDFFEPGLISRRRDAEWWNVRLFVTDRSQKARLVDLRGNTAEGTLTDGTMPWMRINYLKQDEQYPTECLGQATMCFPSFDSKAHKLYVVLPRVNACHVNNSAAGQGLCQRALFLRIGNVLVTVQPFERTPADPFATKVRSNVSGFLVAKPADEAPDSAAAPTVQESAEKNSLEKSTEQ